MRLTTVSDHPDMWAEAVCADPRIAPDVFFPEEWDAGTHDAQVLCGDCPLLIQCARKALENPIGGGVVASVPMPPQYADASMREAARRKLAEVAAGGAPLLCAPGEKVPVWEDVEFQVRVHDLRKSRGMGWPEISNRLRVSTGAAQRALELYTAGTDWRAA